MALEQLSPRPWGLAVKKIEAFIRHEAFEPIRSELVEAIRIRTGGGGEEVLQAHPEEEIAAGSQAE